jgi:hypothetical protein
MEADWEFEVGGDAPVIDARWPGLIDLQSTPERAWNLPEAVQLPAMAVALVKLNAAPSPVWTSKCDVWDHLGMETCDAGELDAPSGCFAHAMGCYIDLLPKSDQQWPDPAMAADGCRKVCDRLHAVPLRCCRVDLIVRRAYLVPDHTKLGITAYLTSCGESPAEASRTLQAALATFADALCTHSTLE